MKIVVLGAATSVHLRQWSRELTLRGHEVHVATVHPSGGLLAKQVWELRPSGPAGYIASVHTLRRVLRTVKPDVLWSHYATGYGTLARLSGFRPRVLSVWGSDVFAFPDRSIVHRSLVAGNLRTSDLVTSTSEVMADRTRALGLADTNVVVVPFGVDLNAFAQPQVATRSTVKIGTVKALEVTYGIDRLLRAFAGCVESLNARGSTIPELELVIAGDGSQRKALEQLARELGISDRTTFTGAIPHSRVPCLLHSFDIFAVLSRAESFGVAAIEAGAAGLPVVCSCAPGLIEVTTSNDGSALARQVRDEREATTAFIELIGDPDLRRRLGESLRRHVASTYGWDECVTALEAAFAGIERA